MNPGSEVPPLSLHPSSCMQWDLKKIIKAPGLVPHTTKNTISITTHTHIDIISVHIIPGRLAVQHSKQIYKAGAGSDIKFFICPLSQQLKWRNFLSDHIRQFTTSVTVFSALCDLFLLFLHLSLLDALVEGIICQQ